MIILLYHTYLDDWTLVFKISTGTGQLPYELWTGPDVSESWSSCTFPVNKSCTSAFKHQIIEKWERYYINQVIAHIYIFIHIPCLNLTDFIFTNVLPAGITHTTYSSVKFHILYCTKGPWPKIHDESN